MELEVHTVYVGRRKPRVKKGFDSELAARQYVWEITIWSNVRSSELFIDGKSVLKVGHGGGDGSDHSKGDDE